MGSRGPATVTAFRGPNGKVGLTVFIFIEKTVWHFFLRVWKCSGWRFVFHFSVLLPHLFFYEKEYPSYE